MTIQGFTVNPANQSVSVSATMQGVAKTLFFDQACTVPAASPQVIHSTTIFYVAAPGTYSISEKIGGNEYATASGEPIVVPVSPSQHPQLTPRSPFVGNIPITGALSAVTDANAKAVLTSIINALVRDGLALDETT